MLRYVPRTDDPEIRARQKHVARVLLDMDPELREEVCSKAYEDGLKQGLEQAREQARERALEKAVNQGRLLGARAALRRVLSRRELSLSTDDDARIEACADLATLERWLDQAVVASSAVEALRGSATP